MFRNLKGFAQFISIERGLMLFMITAGAAFLTVESLVWPHAICLGLIVFCAWSGLDALNNIFDVDLDVTSDPFRAEYTRKLGKSGFAIVLVFSALSLGLGIFTMIPLVILFIVVGIFFGILYSVPPFRLRQTIFKPLVNFTVGAVPVLVVAAFSRNFAVNVVVLALVIGITTGVNSLWEDLADYASDFAKGARTVPIILGPRRGLLIGDNGLLLNSTDDFGRGSVSVAFDLLFCFVRTHSFCFSSSMSKEIHIVRQPQN